MIDDFPPGGGKVELGQDDRQSSPFGGNFDKMIDNPTQGKSIVAKTLFQLIIDSREIY